MLSNELIARLKDPQRFLDELVRRDFSFFMLRAFPTIRGGAPLVPNWHIDAMAYALSRTADQSCRRLVITLPPRSLKSFTASVAWVAWQLGRDPKQSFVCVSYSNDLSGKFARDCKAIIQAGWYRRTFPRTIISAQRTASSDFDTTAGGGRLATSIAGTLTGRGGDVIIIDDALKPDEASSEAIREGVNDWFFTTLASRLNDKRNGAIIAVMQRLHEYDLAGMLLETGEWDQLCLPAIAKECCTVDLTRGRKYIRPEGEALHGERDPLSELLGMKARIGSTLFEAQYQQEPLPAEGNIVKAHWLQTYAEVPVNGTIVQSWDTASKEGEHCDWSVCITSAVIGRKIYVLHVWREKVEFTDLWKATQRLARDWKASCLLIEDTANGTALIQRLRNDQPPGVPSPIARKPKLDKLSRMSAASSMIEAEDLLLPKDAPWLGTFKAELLGFPSGRNDDQVDALSQLMNWVDARTDDSYGVAGPIIPEPSSEYWPDWSPGCG